MSRQVAAASAASAHEMASAPPPPVVDLGPAPGSAEEEAEMAQEEWRREEAWARRDLRERLGYRAGWLPGDEDHPEGFPVW